VLAICAAAVEDEDEDAALGEVSGGCGEGDGCDDPPIMTLWERPLPGCCDGNAPPPDDGVVLLIGRAVATRGVTDALPAAAAAVPPSFLVLSDIFALICEWSRARMKPFSRMASMDGLAAGSFASMAATRSCKSCE
jgi:hypothetical protein